MATYIPSSNTTTAVAYLRQSTVKQEVSGLGIAAQERDVNAFCAARGLTLLATFVETESGKRNQRAELAKALGRARRTKSVLVVSTLTRLSRDLGLVTKLLKSTVPFVCADAPNDDEMVTKMKAVFAEEELRKVSARTKAAMAILKARGVVLGKPENFSNEGRSKGSKLGAAVNAARAHEEHAAMLPEVLELRQQGLSLRAIATQVGVSYVTVARMLKRS